MPINRVVYSVSDINKYIKAIINNDQNLRFISVKGEISNLKYGANGHVYFSLKDKESIIKNVYRVLLTRSRKGMFIYFPMDTKLDETFNWFKKCIKLNGN